MKQISLSGLITCNILCYHACVISAPTPKNPHTLCTIELQNNTQRLISIWPIMDKSDKRKIEPSKKYIITNFLYSGKPNLSLQIAGIKEIIHLTAYDHDRYSIELMPDTNAPIYHRFYEE